MQALIIVLKKTGILYLYWNVKLVLLDTLPQTRLTETIFVFHDTVLNNQTIRASFW